ncbi:MAG: metalloregulator ArsR/SmtB family transcription factor [Sphingomonadales bacterium]|nr:metalloregulator ArsR/SmtB family transcription factor [Sphingomonadales bacterium]
MDNMLTLMRALADPTRLRIAILIRQLELSVGELVQILGQSQPRVSRHIRILDEAGLAERRKEGSWVFLRPGPQLLAEHISALFTATTQDDARIIESDLKKLELVRAGRAQMAASYFEHHAGEWDSLRSLHVAESEVEAAMQQYLTISPLGRVLDIGTGTGRMIELFAKEAEHFTAIDNSAEMLRLARAKLAAVPAESRDAGKIDIMLGDFNALPLNDSSFDTILFHQVLHYAQAPERVIAEAARVLAPSGRMMIVDFAPHDREELRSVHAHARLGFSNDLILRAFANGGMHLAHHATLDGGELTVKIWLGQKFGQKKLDGSQPDNPDMENANRSGTQLKPDPQMRPKNRPEIRIVK